MSRRMGRRPVIGAFAATGVLAACGGGKKQSAAVPQGVPPEVVGTPPPEPAGPPRTGGTLRLGVTGPEPGFEPAAAVNWVHSSLSYGHTHRWSTAKNAPVLDLATGFEQPDPLTLIVTLRRDARFAEGVAGERPVAAEDVAYSWRRIPALQRQPGTGMPKLLWSWLDPAPGASFESPDVATLVIRLATPFAEALPALGRPEFAVVAREVAEAAPDRTLRTAAAAGSGPYRFTRRDGATLRYARNPAYRPGPAGTPYPDEVEVRQYADQTALSKALLAGDIDLAPGTVRWGEAELVTLKGARNARTVDVASPDHLVLGFDCTRLGLDPRVREAIARSLDHGRIAKAVHGSNGRRSGPVAAGIGDLAWSEERLVATVPFDPASAKQLWAASGASSTFGRLRILADAGSLSAVKTAEAVAEDLRKALNIEASVDARESTSYVSRAVAEPRDWDLVVAANASVPTLASHNALSYCWPGGLAGVLCGFKTTGVTDSVAREAAEFQAMYEAQLTEVRMAERKQALDRLQEAVLRRVVPVIPLPVAAKVTLAVGAKVGGYPAAEAVWGPGATGELRSDLWLAV